ncbi:MAG: PAS domain-containing protein [Alphaproteobacteria bacterium]|nr:PAS domain-containing protein [Alphaproteobacteria bacterium]
MARARLPGIPRAGGWIIRHLAAGVLGFVLGAATLCTLAFFQKSAVGADPYLARGYIVPFSFGGCSGFLVGLFFSLSRMRLLNLLEVERQETRRARDQASDQEILANIVKRVIGAGDLRAVLQGALETLLQRHGRALHPKGSIYLVDRRTGLLTMTAEVDMPPALLKSCASLRPGECLCGRAALGETVIHVAHVDHRHDISYAGMEPHGHYCAPIRAGDVVLGVLNLYVADGHDTSGEEDLFISSVADLLSTAILRKRNEEELRLNQTIIDHTTDFLSVVDRDYAYRFVSPAYLDAFGKGKDEIVGRTGREVLGQAYFETVSRPNLERGLAGETVVDQSWIDTPVRGRRFMKTRYEPVIGSDGSVSDVVVVAHDLTEQKLADDELRRHREHLEALVAERTRELEDQARRLEISLKREQDHSTMQQQFISLVSHEFRTPLSIIDGAAQRLLRRKEVLSPDEVETRVGKVRHAVRRMVGLIDATLYAAREDEHKIAIEAAPCALGPLLADICDRQLEAAPHHDIHVDIQALPPSIVADANLLDLTFTNILSNAVKYSPQASRIDVKGWTDGDFAVVAVTDRGIGIPASDMARLFQRFYRAATAKGIPGTGLGLSVCKNFVDMHGGEITAASTEGQGTTITVRLPVAGAFPPPREAPRR